MSQLLLEEMILFLIHDFVIVTCIVSPLSRLTAHLLPVYRATSNFSCLPSMKTFVTDISASTGRNDFIFDMWLWHGDLYRVSPSPFQVYCTSTSCLPSELELFMFAAVMKIFVTDISASTGRNDFIFDIWFWHGDLYRVSAFQVYRTSTSCLQCDLEFFMFAVIKTFVTDISASTGRNDFIFDIWLLHGDLASL
jgi:hypothetical protein